MKKFTSVFLAFIMLLSNFSMAFGADEAGEEVKNINLYSKGEIAQLLTWQNMVDLNNFGAAIVVHKDSDGTEKVAYCLDPSKPGVENTTAKNYDVSVDNLITNPQVWGAITNGYPYKTVSELGVDTEFQAYYATKIAVWALVHANYGNVEDWRANGPQNEKVLTAMKKIREAGLSTTSISQNSATVTAIPSPAIAKEDLIDKKYLSQTFTVSVGDYTVSMGSDAPSGTKITDEQNNAKTSFKNGEKFKVLIPVTGEKRDGSFNLDIATKTNGKVILYGKSYDISTQDYAVTKSDDKTIQATAKYEEKAGKPEEPTEPDEPDKPKPQSGKLQILKQEYGTTKGLAGAKFKVTDADGGVVGVYYTDGSGQVTVPLEDLGAYYVEEIVPPVGYQLDKENHKDIVVTEKEDAILTFSNKPTTDLKISKVDADTNQTLSGATIRVAYDGGHKFVDVTTDGTGQATVTNLPDGTYTVTEIVAPSGYILDSTPHAIKLESGKPATITLKNRAKPGLLIKKFDEGTGLPLEFAEFSVKKKDGSIVYEGITGKDGTIKVEDLEADWYTVTEIAAPPGYLITTESKDVKLEPNKLVEVKFDNRKRPSLQIMKLDSETNLPLAGAKFYVKKTESQTVSEYVTDATGTIVINDLEEAIYTVWEYEAPDGYLLDEQHKDIQLEWGKTKTLVFTNKAKPALEILKIDEETKEPLAGAKFKVTQTESNTTSEYVTDKDGRILITGLEDKIYSVKEIVAPSGYILEGQHKDIELEWGKTKTLVFTNKAKPKLKILKVDVTTGKPLPNAEFRVTKVEDKTVSEYITDETGTILIENLDEAVYKAEEFMPPDGYILYTESKEIMTEWGKTKTLKFDNIRKPVLVFLKSNGLTGLPVAGATFKVEYESKDGGTKNIGSFKTGKDGLIIIPKVNPGWYIFTETRPAPGFSLPKDPVTRMYVEAGQNAYLPEMEKYYSNTGAIAPELPNTVIPPVATPPVATPPVVGNPKPVTKVEEHSGSEYIVQGEEVNWPLNSVVIKKTHAVTGALLAGASFELYRADEQVSGVPGTSVGRYTTDNSGVIVITGLEPGYYVVKEVQAPQNFLISEANMQNGFLKADGTTVLEFSFANHPYGSILISKVDGTTGTPLAGAKFKVTDANGAAVGNTTGEFTTDSKGEILIENVAPGSYVVTEIQAPSNYAINTTPKTVEVGTDGKTYKVSFDNYPYGSILISKVDGTTGTPLAGAKFKVTDTKGTAVGNTTGEFISDSKGEILIENVAPGSYVVTEIQAPDNYAINTTPKTVEVGTDGKTYKISFDNYPYGTLVILKKDTMTKEALANAEFKVTTAKGDVVGTGNGTFITDATGKITIPNLPKGSYIVKETKAPDGYILENQSKTIEIEYAKTHTLEFFNNKKSGLQIIKIDSNTKQPLKHAQFTVYKKSGEVLGNYETDADGVIIIDNLAPGWVKIVETKAPDGYLLDETPKDIEITNNQFVKVVFENNPMASVIIKKFDASTKAPLSGATFKVTKKLGDIVGEYSTDNNGIIQIDNLETGWYSAVEVKAPIGYKLVETIKDFEVVHTKTVTLEFPNEKLTSLIIKKTDDKTGAPLAGASFRVEKQNGQLVGEYTTDSDGLINIPTLSPDWYVIRETRSPDGYFLDETPKTIEVKVDVPTLTTFTNKKMTGIQIKKIDETTGVALSGAVFTVEKQDGEKVGDTYTTDATGFANIPNLAPGYYVVTEIQAPENYLLSNTPKTVEVKTNAPTIITFTNKYKSGLQIIKEDSETGTPLSGAKFTVYKKSGDIVGEYVTDKNGVIIIDSLDNGWYKIAETKAPDGYMINETPKDVEIVGNQFLKIVFGNKKLAGLQIKKIDETSGAALSGAVFTVEKQNGEKIYTNGNGTEFVTDAQGFINIPDLMPDYYIVKEVKAPENYILDNTPKTVEVKPNVPTVVIFSNKYKSGLQIIKMDAASGTPLPGAKFSVYKKSGEIIGDYVTDKNGVIILDQLENGWYKIAETKAPDGYMIDETPKDVEIVGNQFLKIVFNNKKLTGLEIKKVDDKTGAPLAGARFTVEKQNGEKVYTNGNGTEFVTDAQGLINIPNLDPDYYIVKEVKAPDGYNLDETPKTVQVKTDAPTLVTFTNKYKSGLQIIKMDAASGTPLPGAKFSVYKKSGEIIGDYVTDKNGVIILDQLENGWYKIAETKAPDGYMIDETPKDVEIVGNQFLKIVFNNKKLTGLEIKKVDDKTGAPLAGARFTVEKQNGEKIYTNGNGTEFVTDAQGLISIPNLDPDYYIVKEVKAPDGYNLDETPKTVQVKTDAPTLVTFTNKYKSGLQIIKMDAVSGTPLPGAKFSVYKKSGEIIGDYITDKNGVIILDQLENGWYKIAETKAPDGYMIDETPKDVEIVGNQFLKIVFNNKKLAGLQIKKIDEVTGKALPGAIFTIEKQNGEKIYTNGNGTDFTTDAQGMINIPNLAPDYYIIKEVKAPEGYTISEATKTVQVKTDTPTVVTIGNKPLAGLKIIKLNAVTRQPIEGVEFAITKMSGEKIENDFRGHTFVTDKTGQIYISDLEDGYYTITETKAADGYFVDSTPKTVEIKSGKPTIVEVLNQPASGLLIVKTDAKTGKPLQGVVFDVKKANGERVTSNILDGNQPNTENNSPNKFTTPNGDISGSYTTDANGRILINTLAPGEYAVTETKALSGYILDTDVHAVTILPGKQTTLQLKNTPMAGLRIVKVDSISKKPILGVEFMVFDENKNVVGTYYTDNNGVIDLSGILEQGRYTIRETKAAEGYYLDEVPKTIEFVSGKMTEIVWTNTPQMGQLQLLKKSADDNEVNGLPAGTPLEGAIFEVYAYKSGNMIDRFVSGSDGKAVSKPLPLGRYIVKEVQAPKNYRISDKQMDIEIEFATQIIKQEFVNYSVNTGVYIKKTGNIEALLGDTIRYDIKAVQNTSTVPLTDFFWRDVVPTDAVRLSKIDLGTYNQSVKYKVMITTNKGDTRVIADNYSSTQSNVVGCSNAELGLRNDEYVTSFSVVFGNVKAGFAQVEQPKVYMTVLKNLPNGYQFANKCDIGGKYQNEWVIGNSTWLTTIYTSQGKLPKTGY